MENETHEKSDWKQYALLIGVGLLLVFTVIQAMQISALQGQIAGNASLGTTASLAGQTQVQQQQSTQNSGGTQMVGGC